MKEDIPFDDWNDFRQNQGDNVDDLLYEPRAGKKYTNSIDTALEDGAILIHDNYGHDI